MVRSASPVLVLMLVAAPLFGDVERPAIYPQSAPTLEDTTWISDDGPLGKVTYFFERGGTLVYTYPNGQVYRNGTWQLQGDYLYFEANQKFREFRARVGSSRIEGPSWNKTGSKWRTTMTPVRK